MPDYDIRLFISDNTFGFIPIFLILVCYQVQKKGCFGILTETASSYVKKNQNYSIISNPQ